MSEYMKIMGDLHLRPDIFLIFFIHQYRFYSLTINMFVLTVL